MIPEIDKLNQAGLRETVRIALAEDIGTGDVTTLTTVPVGKQVTGTIVAKESGVMAGLPVVQEVFRQVGSLASVKPRLKDGDKFANGATLFQITGSARAILTGERVALNFLQRLCGIATLTAQFVEKVSETGAKIVDTRKTTPGLRILEKYAVTMGGGNNHRMGLYDAVMIKDNHIVAAGGISKAVFAARKSVPHTMTVTVECETLDQVDEALNAGANILLLDNMDLETLMQAVSRAKGRAITEASGGVTLNTVLDIAKTGVDIISVGSLTNSARAIDLSLELEVSN